MPLYVPATGLLQFGAPAQSRTELGIVFPLQITVGGFIAVPAVPDVGTLSQVNTEDTVNVPQFAVLLLSPQLAVADTLYVAAIRLSQFGAFAHAMVLVTVLMPHLTVGGIIAEPVTPVIGIPVQVSSSAEGAAIIVNAPLQLATLPLQFPLFAITDISL